MAIVREGSASKNDASFLTTGGSLAALALQCGTNPNRLAIVGTAWNPDGTVAVVTGVTIGGNAMTALSAAIHSAFVSKLRVWAYLGPGTGSQDIVVSYDAGAAQRAAIVLAAAYSGVHQVTPLAGLAGGTTTGSNCDVTVASAAGGLIVAIGSSLNGVWSTDDAGASEILDASRASDSGQSATLSERPWAASVTAQHTSPNANGCVLGFSIQEAAAAGTNTTKVDRSMPRGQRRGQSRGRAHAAFHQLGNLLVPDRRILVPVGIQLAGAR